MEKTKVFRHSFPIIKLEKRQKVAMAGVDHAKEIKELYYTPKNEGLLFTPISRGTKKTIIKFDRFGRNKEINLIHNTPSILTTQDKNVNSFSSDWLTDNFNNKKNNSLLNADYSVKDFMNRQKESRNVKCFLPSLARSMESDKLIKSYNVFQSRNMERQQSEEALILSRLKNRGEYGSFTGRNVISIQDKSNSNNNFMKLVNPKTVDKNVLTTSQKTKGKKECNTNTNTNINTNTNTTITTTTTVQKQMSARTPTKIVINQALPFKLDNKDSSLNIPKNNDNISSSTSIHNAKKPTEKIPKESTPSKVSVTNSSEDDSEHGEVEIQKKVEEKEKVSDDCRDKDKTTTDSNYKQLVSELSQDLSSKEKLISCERRQTIWPTKNFITQLSKISEQSNKISKECDSNSFEKSGKSLIQFISMSNSPYNHCKVLFRSRTNVRRGTVGTVDGYEKLKNENKTTEMKRALSMKNCNRRTLSMGNESSDTVTKKNNTIHEEGKSISSSIVSNSILSETPRRPKLVKKYSTNLEFKRRASFISITSLKGASLQRPQSVCRSSDSFTYGNDPQNVNLPKLLQKLGEEITEREARIEELCNNAKIKYLDKAITKVVDQFEKEEEDQKIDNHKFLYTEKLSYLYERSHVGEDIFFIRELSQGEVNYKMDNINLNVDVGPFYKNLLVNTYFDVNILQKVFVEGYLMHDFADEFRYVITLIHNFKLKHEVSFLKAGLTKNRGTFKRASKRLSMLKDRESLFDSAYMFHALGGNNSKYINRYLLLDTVDKDGMNKLSSFNSICDADVPKFGVYLKRHVKKSHHSPDEDQGKWTSKRHGGSISTEGEGDIRDITIKPKNIDPYYSKSPKRLEILSKASREDENKLFRKRHSMLDKLQNFFIPGMGVIGGCMVERNEDKFLHKWSLLQKDFYSRTRDKETNQVFGKISRQMEVLNRFLQKRRSRLINTPIQNFQDNRKEEEKEHFTAQDKHMNKESTMFRTYEIKSCLLTKFKETNKALFFYIKEDNFQIFKDYMEKHKIPTEVIDDEGNTFLNLAVQCNNYQITNYLLKCGADVNTQNNKCNTPLHYALTYKNFQISDLLIQSGADETLKNIYGLTPWQCLSNMESIVI